jgi:lipid-A-disaccharide synthase
MQSETPLIMVVAGEESGDMRLASLVAEIKALRPGARFTGIGGNRCRQQGVRTFADIADLAVFGFSEVIRHFPRIKRVFDMTVARARTERPSLAILVDYPGFNLRLAKELKKLGIKVIYYVSPQVWAWKSSRIKTIKAVVTRMMVLFDFEKALYAKHGYAADFVGHPLIDEVRANTDKEPFLRSIGLDPQRPVLALLPGSRPQEILRLLPIMLQAGADVQKQRPEVQLVLLKARNLPQSLFNPQLISAPPDLKVSEDYYNALNACDAAIVCSGTATLETCLLHKPMVVVYRTSWLTWGIGRMLIKIDRVSLVNIVAGKKIVEELLQKNATALKIAQEALRILDPVNAQTIRKDLKRINAMLGDRGASARAARVVLEELG